MHSQANAAGKLSVPEEPFGELRGTLRVRPFRRDPAGWLSF
jgi:hypothetical protein